MKAINDKTHLSTKKYFENPPIIIHKNAAGNKHFHRIPHCIMHNSTSKLISPQTVNCNEMNGSGVHKTMTYRHSQSPLLVLFSQFRNISNKLESDVKLFQERRHHRYLLQAHQSLIHPGKIKSVFEYEYKFLRYAHT